MLNNSSPCLVDIIVTATLHFTDPPPASSLASRAIPPVSNISSPVFGAIPPIYYALATGFSAEIIRFTKYILAVVHFINQPPTPCHVSRFSAAI